jgi:hypothetical protein
MAVDFGTINITKYCEPDLEPICFNNEDAGLKGLVALKSQIRNRKPPEASLAESGSER